MIFLQPCVRLRIIKSQRQNGRMGSLRLSLSGMDFRVYGMPTVCGGTMIWLKKDGFDEEIIMSATFRERIKGLRNYMDIRCEYSLTARANIAVLLQLISITNKKEILQLRKIAWLEQLKEIFRTNEPVYVLEEIDS